jgi:hypothetical protein
MKIISRMLILLCILSSIAACVSTPSWVEGSLISFSDPDLEGMWEAHYDLYDGVEILVFNQDKTYVQLYEDPQGFLYSNDTGTWEIKKDASNRVFVHLDGGLWFPLGAKNAQLKGKDSLFSDIPYPYYDHTAKKVITMLNELILEVIPRANRKGFVLFQFASDIDVSPEHFEPAIK